MPLHLQDPEDPDAPVLLESILSACDGALTGGALFAFATQTGIRLLMHDETFIEFINNGPFDLLVGLDAVTDQKALDALSDFKTAHPNLRARVFVHNRSGTMFHPKTVWFRKRGGGTLITGSGNLTVGGLRKNWEAFTVTKLNSTEVGAVEASWRELSEVHAAKLLELTSAEAVERAARNSIRDLRPRWDSGQAQATETGGPTTPTQVLAAGPGELITDASPVLVAELPRAADRWNQANFSLDVFTNFFGANVATQKRILLQHVRPDGTLEGLESRPTIVVMSRNFRLELDAAKGKPYPNNGRPVAVFVRQQSGIVLYRLVLPSDGGDYTAVTALLSDKWNGPTRQVRRVITTAQELRSYWSNSPIFEVDTTPE